MSGGVAEVAEFGIRALEPSRGAEFARAGSNDVHATAEAADR